MSFVKILHYAYFQVFYYGRPHAQIFLFHFGNQAYTMVSYGAQCRILRLDAVNAYISVEVELLISKTLPYKCKKRLKNMFCFVITCSFSQSFVVLQFCFLEYSINFSILQSILALYYRRMNLSASPQAKFELFVGIECNNGPFLFFLAIKYGQQVSVTFRPERIFSCTVLQIKNAVESDIFVSIFQIFQLARVELWVYRSDKQARTIFQLCPHASLPEIHVFY